MRPFVTFTSEKKSTLGVRIVKYLIKLQRQQTKTICMQVRKQESELDMEQQTGSKSGKEYVKAVYCHPARLTYMQSTS